MSIFLDDYIHEGFSGIVLIGWDSHEESGGYQTETDTEAVVAKTKDGKYVKIDAKQVRKFGPRAGGPKTTIDTSFISEDEYARLANGKAVLDTDQVRKQIDQKRALETVKDGAHKEFLRSAPRCPVHGVKMRLAKGSSGSFWSCPKYSSLRCKQTSNLSEHQKALLAQSGR